MRKDVKDLEMVVTFWKEFPLIFRRQQQGSNIKPLYVLLYQLAEELDDEDLKKAKFLYGKMPKSRKLSSGLDLFTVMVQQKDVEPENVSQLRTIFTGIQRIDLVELIDRYTGKVY